MMESCRDVVGRFHYCDDSRVNFSMEIELQPLNAVKRRPPWPMSGELLCFNSTSFDRFNNILSLRL